MSQEAEILAHLQKGHYLTPLDALEKFGCMRLGARIHQLRQEGHDIHNTPITANGKRFACYWMSKGAIARRA